MLNNTETSQYKFNKQLDKDQMHSLTKKQKHINTIILLIVVQVIISASLIQSLADSSKQLIIILIKICIDLTMLMFILIRRNYITEKQALILLTIDRLIMLIAISIIRHPDCIFLVIQLCYSLQMTDSSLLFYSFIINASGKLGLLLQISFFRLHQLSFVCSIALVLLDILEYLQLQKMNPIQPGQFSQQLFEINSHPNSPCSIKNQNEKDNIWIQRIQDVKIQVIILSRKSLKVKYINTCFQELCCCNTVQDLQDIILNKLSFQIPQQCTELYRNTSIQIKKLRDRQREESRRELQNLESTKCVAAQTSLTLNQILADYKAGKYEELVNASSSKSLDISCTSKFGTGNLISLSGSIHCDGKEITIFINDISKQTELSQFKIKEDFKSKIVESFSHEMRTPLNSATNLIQSSLSEPNILQQTKDSLLMPAYNSLRLQSFIINDIIDFSNYYANSLFLQTKDFSFTELINEISELFRFQFKHKNMGFKFVMVKNELTSFNTDYCRLLQVIVNLLQNSIKFSNGGNVIVSFKSVEQRRLKISIRDQGFGIHPEKLTQIQQSLQQFQQTQDMALTNQWHGFGLLISSIILSRISPNLDSQVLNIKSNGLGEGTKVVILIENQQHILSTRMSKKSLRLGTRINSSKRICVGTVIITQINDQSYDKCINFTPLFKTADNNLEQYSNDKSSNISLNSKMDQLEMSSPKLLTYLNPTSSPRLKSDYVGQKLSQNSDQFSINQFKDLRSAVSVSYKSQIMSIQQIKCLEDYESEQNLLQFEQKKKCKCNRLLSIDDEVFNQHSIQMLLSKLGFEVLIAFNGKQALDLIVTLEKCGDSCQLLSLILMDYQMPILDGVETTRLLIKMMKEQKIPYINIIGLTAFTSEEDVRKCLSAGMFDVLSKPLNLKEFKELLSIM